MATNPIDKVINRKAVEEGVNKEINRRRNISKITKGKKRTRKDKNKFKKRKKKKVTTTQVAQPPIKLSNKEGDKLEVNIVAKERRKKRVKSYAEKRAEEIAKTGIADPSILKQQQRVASEILGYKTQTRDPIALRDRRGRYNVSGGVGGFSNISSVYEDRYGRGRKGLRTGVQSEAIDRDRLISDLEALERQREISEAAESRRKRQAQFRATRRDFGTQTKKDDDDDDDDDTPPPPPNVKIRPSLPQPQPEPEQASAYRSRLRTPPPSAKPETRSTSTFTAPLQTISTGTSPIPAPIPRRTPPEDYFAGRLRQDTPLRFRPINLPDVPPQEVDEETDDEIAGLTGGDTPQQVGIQPISPARQSAQDPTPEPFDPDDEGFATPTLTESQAQFPPPRPTSRPLKQLPASLLRPSSREALEREGITFTDTPVSIGTGGAFVRPQTRQSPAQLQPEPEQIQSVSRGRGRPRGSKNKPRNDTPAILESTKDEIARADLKLTMTRIASILKRRLGSFSLKDLDDIQSLGELQELVDSMDVDDETAGLLQDFWQIRIQLGKIKKV
jgi:hypothetical protein